MPDLWLAQVLCPARHCILAIPYDRAERTAGAVDLALAATMERYSIKQGCALCGSTILTTEHAKMRYSTWEEALPILDEEQQKQILTRALFDSRT